MNFFKMAMLALADNKRRRLFMGVAVLVVSALLGTYFLLQRDREKTDNAQVEALLLPLVSRVSGTVTQVLVSDNAQVHKGDVVAIIDRTDYEAKMQQLIADRDAAIAGVNSAEAQERIVEHTSRGNFSIAKAQLVASADTERSAQAQIAAAQSASMRTETEFHHAELNLERSRKLLESKVISEAEFENSENAYRLASASLQQAKANLRSAQEQFQLTKSHRAEAKGRLDQSSPVSEQLAVARANANAARSRLKSLEAAIVAAKGQLDACEIRTSVDGVISRLAVQPGQYIGAGQTVAMAVPEETFVVANFKEIQVSRIQKGEKAVIEIDALPGRSFEGVVDSISPATGSKFALIPTDTASGNFVKVVQRIPVKISLRALPQGLHLQAGLSANVTVFTN